MKFILVAAFLFLQSICFAAGFTPNLTAVYDVRKMAVVLKWQNNDDRISGFVLQRSSDDMRWTDVHTIIQAELSENKIEKFTDHHPDPTRNYYRIKMIDNRNDIEYSSSIMIIMGQATNSWVIYPVPVGPVIHLQYTGSAPIPSIITVFIQSSNGRIFNRQRCSSLSRTIQVPVSNLGKGIYDIRIMIMDKVVWNQRFIK